MHSCMISVRHPLCFIGVWAQLIWKGLVKPAMGDAFDLTELSKAWDEVESIRESLRAGNPLLKVSKTGCDSSIHECKENFEVLTPLLHRLFACRLKLPEIQPLRVEIEDTYTKSNREVPESQIDDDAWDLRTMLRFIKRKANRSDVSKDSQHLGKQRFCFLNHSGYFLTGVQWETMYFIEVAAPKDHDFQDMVLILRPELEAGPQKIQKNIVSQFHLFRILKKISKQTSHLK